MFFVLKHVIIRNMEKNIRVADIEDLHLLVNLAVQLWPEHSEAELACELSEIITHGESQFLLMQENDLPVGFAQCQLRHDYVEGTSTTPVGYLEGIFIKEGYRNKGYAKELLEACESWARRNGCHELASDCEIGNTGSFLFHKAMKFKEVNRIICFKKEL